MCAQTIVLRFLLLCTSLLILFQPALANQCELKGHTISVEYTACPDQNRGIDSACRRTRQRFVVLGSKVLHYHDEVSPEGTVYELGKKVELENNPDNRRFFGNPKPGLTRRIWLTASYSAGQLRLKKDFPLYAINNNELILESSSSYVFDIESCETCKLTHHVSEIRSVSPRAQPQMRRVLVLFEQTCRIRKGV
jgi:hypothetical protein